MLEGEPPIPVPPPPPAGSEAEKAELAEVFDLNRRRRDPQSLEAARRWSRGACVGWNETARLLVAKHRTDHARASRIYALTAVAQHDALVSVWRNKILYKRRSPTALDGNIEPLYPLADDPSYPCAHAAVATASALVLSYLFPDEAPSLSALASGHRESRLWAGACFRSDVDAGDNIGRAVAALAIAHGKSDGHDEPPPPVVVVGDLPGRWESAPGEMPVTAHWGAVKPWLIPSAQALRAPPPPGLDSPMFRTALDEVKRASDRRTLSERRLAALWADGDGSYAPAGRWNKTACDLVSKHQLDELEAGRTLGLLNLALMDVGIACWDSKYHYLVPRPSQLDPAITLPVGLPNHPSYPSAHASFSGAAAGVLARLFPADARHLREDAEEATLSRLHGGIHYRFDGDAGLAQGKAVAEIILSWSDAGRAST